MSLRSHITDMAVASEATPSDYYQLKAQLHKDLLGRVDLKGLNALPPEQLRDQLRKEIGDVFVYLDLMAQSLGFTIADAAAEVFNAKSAEIGYPKQI